MTFDLDLWPTNLTINRDHLLIKDYLPTTFEASGAKRCWVIRCTRFGRLTWPLTLTFDLLTWLLIGIIYSSRTIYLPSLKLLGQSVVEISVAQGLEDWHDLWPWTLTYWPDYQKGSSTHQGLSTYQVWSFRGKAFQSYPLHKVRETDMTFDLGPTDWQSIGIIYSSRTIYLPSLKLLGQSVVELSVAQGLEDWHDLWPWPLTYQPDYQ